MSLSTSFQNRLCNDIQVTIANNATVSSSENLGGTSLVAVKVPAGFAGTKIRFQGNFDNINFFDIKSAFNGDYIEAIVGPNAMYTIEQPALHICNYIKIVALTTQTQEIVLNLLTRGA